MRRLPAESGDGLCYVPALPSVAALSPVHPHAGTTQTPTCLLLRHMLTPTCLRSVSRRLSQLQATPWRVTSYCARCELSLQELAPVHIVASAKHLRMFRSFASTCLGLDICGIATNILVRKGPLVSDRLQRAAIVRAKACYCASANCSHNMEGISDWMSACAD